MIFGVKIFSGTSSIKKKILDIEDGGLYLVNSFMPTILYSFST